MVRLEKLLVVDFAFFCSLQNLIFRLGADAFYRSSRSVASSWCDEAGRELFGVQSFPASDTSDTALIDTLAI